MEKTTLQKLGIIGIGILLPVFLLLPAFGQTKPVELKFASISAPTHVLNVKVHEPWIKKVEEASGGKLKVTLYPGGSLGPAKQAFDIAAKGIADISYGWVHYHPGRFPLSDFAELPGLVPNFQAIIGLWDIYQKYCMGEWNQVKVLWLGINPSFHFASKEKQIRTLDDVKNLKFGLSGALASKVILALGGVPVDIPAQDGYTGFQRGVIDGYVNTWSSDAANKYGEVSKYFTNAWLYNAIFFCVMNLDTYKSLPPDIKKVIDDNSGRAMYEMASKAYWDDEESGLKRLVDQTNGKGVVYSLPRPEQEKYRKIVKPILDEWIQRVDAKGLPGTKLMEDVEKVINK
jgi:TRAP-type transport system periplasmic protein